MKKVFLMNMFGSPFDWSQKWIDNVQHLGEFGYDFKIFTPNPLESKGNVTVYKMSIEGFNLLAEEKLGVNPNMRIVDGKPSFHITDFIVALGKVFEDYTKEYDFWGATGFDDVFGRLDHFVKEDVLKECDIFSDDVNKVNGNFLLCKNNETINTLFKHIENWRTIFTQPDCEACVEKVGIHKLYSPEEYIFNEKLDAFKELGIKFAFPKYYAYHSYDRLSLHVPMPNLVIKDDNSLWEVIPDTNPPKWEHFNPMAREIAYFHFSKTKVWPL